jgi:excisionase family DNA binding protein
MTLMIFSSVPHLGHVSGETSSTLRRRRAQARLLTLRASEAAAAFGVSRASMCQVVARGEVRTVRIGRRILIPVAELQRLLERR